MGQSGRRETVGEIRLETLVSLKLLDGVLIAMRAAHTYETPAYDIVRLHGEAEHKGFGRVGPLDEPAPLSEIVERLKAALSLPHLIVAGPMDRRVTTAAVGAGATGDLLGDALRATADLFVLGEMRHHDALRAVKANTSARRGYGQSSSTSVSNEAAIASFM